MKIEAKLGKEPERQLLWHGTSKTEPKCIYEGEVGFDTRYSRAGMWGIAMYFAKNAKYSDSANGGYKFINPAGESVLFFAEVLLGETVTLAYSTQSQ